MEQIDNTESKREILKQQRAINIIERTKEVLLEQGYEHASMDKIVSASGLTKRTLYKYFSSKEDLFFAVLLDACIKVWDPLTKSMENEKNGLQKIKLACETFQTLCKADPTLLQLLSLTNLLNKRAKDSAYKDEVNAFGKQIYTTFYGVFEMGIADNSIKNDLDIDFTMKSFMLSIISFFNTKSLSLNMVLVLKGFNEEKFLKNTINHLIATIRNSDTI